MSLNPRDVVIVDGVRTAMGRSKGGSHIFNQAAGGSKREPSPFFQIGAESGTEDTRHYQVGNALIVDPCLQQRENARMSHHSHGRNLLREPAAKPGRREVAPVVGRP